MFLRTNSGISNRAIFTNSDYTLYVEGGGGVEGAGSSDVVFWGDVFQRLRPDLKVTIVAYEGKPELEKIAQKIISGEIANTIVAMDSDFDDFLGEKRSHNNVIYTYGYSWENDAFCKDSVEASLRKLLKLSSLPEDKAEAVFSYLDTLFRKLVPWVNADFWLRTMKSSLFPKASLGRLFSNCPGSFEVEISSRELKKLYKERRGKVKAENFMPKPDVWILSSDSFLHEHAMQLLMRCFLNYALRVFGKRILVNDDLIEHVMIPNFCQHINVSADHRSAHYRNQLSMIA